MTGPALSGRRLCRPAAAMALVATACSLIGVAIAASPAFWHVSTQADLLRGDLEQLSVDDFGRLSLAPRTDVVYESTAPVVWAVARAQAGAVWVGTGDDGRVYHIDADGTATELFDAEEAQVHALARRPNGGVYVGTSPNGLIYAVAPDGTATPFFDPDETYIWSLVVSADGALFAATGTKGIIYRIAPDGTGEPYYDTKTTHALSLAFESSGALLATTESPGRLFRIAPDRSGFILLDSDFPELRGLRVSSDGTIYVAAVRGTADAAASPAAAPQASVSVSTEITLGGTEIQASATPSAVQQAPSELTAGAVFRVQPDGLWDQIWDSSSDAPYDLALDQDGTIVVGTGPDGRIYRLDGPPGTATLLTRAAARQVTSLLYDARGRLHIATANPGTLLALGDSLAAEGTYVSDVRDAQHLASWGTIRWDAVTPPGTRVELYTRSGNTDTPDDTWSAWSESYDAADGQPITSPRARYLQWRAILHRGDESPVLTSVTAAYLPRNLRPTVTSITVHPAGTVFQEPFSSAELEIAGYNDAVAAAQATRLEAIATTQATPPALGRRAYRKSLQSLTWIAEDPNGDRLEYTVRYRLEGGATWSDLTTGLTDPIFVWDTASVPDGTYVISIEASDAPSNSPSRSLIGSRASPTFDVDNTPPRITIAPNLAGPADAPVTFTVQDAQSIIERVEYSFDGNRWEPLYPIDGIADARVERFSLAPPTAQNAVSFTLRATDAMNNTATSTAALPSRGR